MSSSVVVTTNFNNEDQNKQQSVFRDFYKNSNQRVNDPIFIDTQEEVEFNGGESIIITLDK